MVVFIELTWSNSSRKVRINPDAILSMEWEPAVKRTSVRTRGGVTYSVVETLDQIEELIRTAPDEPTTSAQAVRVGGVGERGPVYGDGAPMDQRDVGAYNGPA